MPIPNPKLEQMHAELCARLSERQGERIRTRQTDSAGGRLLDSAAAEIRNWAEDAGRINASAGDSEQIAELIGRARQISMTLN
ncbi:hypothetical protein [Leisingera thetidis]|uniref:hypothetical protein n=1 Tax=Leisingera thetidis TaxID=2930199 RepID=UPI0021F74D93|nr:hypothetical protein [Leisingera thetidis]